MATKSLAQSARELQQICVRWFRYKHSAIDNLLIPTSFSGTREERLTNSYIGYIDEAPDMVLLYPSREYSSLCVKFIPPHKGLNRNQNKWRTLSQRHGNYYFICNNFEQFVTEIDYYLDLEIEINPEEATHYIDPLLYTKKKKKYKTTVYDKQRPICKFCGRYQDTDE